MKLTLMLVIGSFAIVACDRNDVAPLSTRERAVENAAEQTAQAREALDKAAEEAKKEAFRRAEEKQRDK